MKQKDNITITREFKNECSSRVLLKKIIQLEFESFHNSKTILENTDAKNKHHKEHHT